MKGHSAFPDGKDLRRIGQVVARLVEQHLTQPAAENDAEHAVKEQVVKLRDRNDSGAATDPVAPEQDELNESDQIHQTVPAHRQRAERKSDGVELGVKKHRRWRVG